MVGPRSEVEAVVGGFCRPAEQLPRTGSAIPRGYNTYGQLYVRNSCVVVVTGFDLNHCSAATTSTLIQPKQTVLRVWSNSMLLLKAIAYDCLPTVQ